MALSSPKPKTYEHTMTPSGASQNNSKPPARKLWQSREQLGKAIPPQKYRNWGKNEWDNIHCPQFMDLANLPENGDSFFGKHRLIVTTPKVNAKSGSSTHHSFNENTQIESLNASSLPGISIVPPEKEGQSAEGINERTMEQCLNNVIPMKTNVLKNRLEVNTPQKNATNAARLHGRDESKQDNKPERTKKNLEEYKKTWMFREKENNLKPPARRLWESNKQLQLGLARPPQEYRNSREDKWDEIIVPQFVDFANFPETADSFFGKHKVVVSTPKVNAESGSSTHHSYHENTLIESLNAFVLSGIDIVPPEKEGQNAENINERTTEQSLNNVTVIQVETNEPKNRMEVNKPLKIATSTARFHGRDENKQDNKPERIKKNLEEDKNPWVFRAKPVPKYLIARKMEINKNNNSAEKMDCEVIEGKRKLQCPDKNKKNTEIWKKPPLVPCPAQKSTCKPKSPPLRTKGRAEERKRFDQAVKMNDTKAQLQRKMELEAKKEQEDREIALLRKQTVHKAQPIRKYKSSVPTIKKRLLTDPKTPNMLKRRRIESHK